MTVGRVPAYGGAVPVGSGVGVTPGGVAAGTAGVTDGLTAGDRDGDGDAGTGLVVRFAGAAEAECVGAGLVTSGLGRTTGSGRTSR